MDRMAAFTLVDKNIKVRESKSFQNMLVVELSYFLKYRVGIAAGLLNNVHVYNLVSQVLHQGHVLTEV